MGKDLNETARIKQFSSDVKNYTVNLRCFLSHLIPWRIRGKISLIDFYMADSYQVFCKVISIQNIKRMNAKPSYQSE